MEEDDFMGFEENSVAEFAKNGLPQKLQQLEEQVVKLESVVSRYETDFLQNLQQALSLLKLNLQNYQQVIATRRRRSQQRLRRRQNSMRSCFMQILMDMQVQFLEMLPLQLNPTVFKAQIKQQADNNLRRLDELDVNEEAPITKVDFFDNIVPNFTEEQWLDTFRMTKKVFSLICNRLKPILPVDNMTPESFVAMCIYALASGSTFRSVGMLFNRHQTYVRSSLYKFVDAFLHVFEVQFLSMPNEDTSISKICEGFAKVSHLPPFAVGVLSIFELPIFAYTRPGFKSYGMDRVIVQALIDDSLLFRKVQVSHQRPSLFLYAPNELTDISQKVFKGNTIPYFVVAPPHYPLRSWLMQKYDRPRKQYQHDFNQALQKINIFRDVALHRLFGRWQILSSTEFIEPESKSLIAKVCCTFHNLLEEYDEFYSEEWSDNIDLTKYEYKEDMSLPRVSKVSKKGKKKRATIARLTQPQQFDDGDAS